MKRTKVLSALDTVEDGAFQMSANWLNDGLSSVAGGLVSMIENSIGIAGIAGSAVTETLRSMTARGELDLYLLRARDMRNNTWQLRGFRLMHVGDDDIGLGAGGALLEIESTTTTAYPSVF